MQPAYVNEFSLTTEYALTHELSLSAGYLGEVGDHLADYRNGNQLTLAQAISHLRKAARPVAPVRIPRRTRRHSADH